MKRPTNVRKFKIAATLVGVLIIAVVGYTLWFVDHSIKAADASLKSANKVSSDVPKIAPITTFVECQKSVGSKMLMTYPEQCVTKAGKKFPDSVVLKTYTSKTEKVSFKYPATWKVVASVVGSSDPKADTLGLQSPDGKVTVSWTSLVDGLGGACSREVPLGSTDSDGLGACPSSVVIKKTPIGSASGLSVAEGYLTSDNKTLNPWIAVLDNSQAVSEREMGYEEFTGRNNGKFSVLFAIGGIGKSSKGLSFTSVDQVKSFFAGEDALAAEQILLSLQY